MEEMKDPYRDMLRAIYISIIIVTVIYVMMNGLDHGLFDQQVYSI